MAVGSDSSAAIVFIFSALTEGTSWAGGPDRLRSLRVRFLGTVLAGHHLRVRGTVTGVRTEDGAQLADCDVVLEVVGADPVVSGTATVVLS